ncbi:MAG: hypothetical protein ABIW76_08395 [Fibrobacteria bacterium]
MSSRLPLIEFLRLSKVVRNGIPRLEVLWNSRDQRGDPVGTDAYIMKTSVTLLRIPGIAEDEASGTDYRIVGVLRQRK